MQIYVTTETTCHDSRHAEEKFGEWYEHQDSEVTGIRNAQPKHATWKCFEVEEADDYFVVSIRYEDGDTFGHSTGNIDIEGVYTSEDEANKIKEQIHTGKYKPGTYESWNGYFNNVEDVKIDHFSLGGYSKVG